MPDNFSRLHPMAQSLAGYINRTYGINFQAGDGWRAPGTVAGETGVHGNGTALDIPVDQNSPQGRRIAADLRAKGFFVYTEPHGTGPHIHVEIDRNPDGSAK